MPWFINDGSIIDFEKLKHLHSEIRSDRKFWHDKSVAYLNWYTSFALATLSAFFLLLTKKESLGNYLILLTILPIITVFLCHYARKSIKICYRQFLEHTSVMAKFEYVLGLYHPIKGDKEAPNFFSEDDFINPRRHLKYIESFRHSTDFVNSELRAPERTFSYKVRILLLLQSLAIILALFIFLAGAIQLKDTNISQTQLPSRAESSSQVKK